MTPFQREVSAYVRFLRRACPKLSYRRLLRKSIEFRLLQGRDYAELFEAMNQRQRVLNAALEKLRGSQDAANETDEKRERGPRVEPR